jgi:hypothetical protein
MPVDGGPPFSGPTTNGTVTVTPGTTVAQIGPGFAGLSYEKSHMQDGFFRGDNAALVALLRLLGPSVLRIGANAVDRTMWETAPVADAGATITKADVDGFAALIKAAGWSAIYGVNMKTSTPTYASEEAAYAVTQLGGNLYGLEIGNEPDLYPSSVVSSYSDFKTKWESFASGIKAGGAGSNVAFTGPASAANYSTWTIPFANDEGSNITLLTQHYYRANGQDPSSTLDLLLQPDPNLVNELKKLSAAAKSNNIANAFRCGECNSFYNGGAAGVSDEYGTALWAIDFLFTNAQYGASGVNFHGGNNVYTPIANDANGNVVEARPLYYGMLVFSLAGTGAMLGTQVSVSNINFTAYAVQPGDGSTNVVLVNKDGSNGVQASVDMGASISSASVIYLTAPSLDATSGITLAGTAVNPDGTWNHSPPYALSSTGTQYSVLVPPGSAALVHVR